MSDTHLVRVRDVMTHDFAMVDGLNTIKEALQIYKRRDASVLIVNKRHEDDEYGLLLLSDIAKNVLAKDRAIDRVNVYEVMTKPVLGIDPNMDVRYCARMFERFGIGRAPVVENGEMIGVVTYHEIVLQGLELDN
ncbi:MAG: CBS domain-containing protein [Marinobacterium sp.]|nr:CBS domain-containing protein [Marinobacterium sp.]